MHIQGEREVKHVVCESSFSLKLEVLCRFGMKTLAASERQVEMHDGLQLAGPCGEKAVDRETTS